MSCSVQIQRVAFDALPSIHFEFDVKLSTSFSNIILNVRLCTGQKLSKTYIVDDDENGLFHFEFEEDEVIEGIHQGELEFYDITEPTNKFTIPADKPMTIIARERI